MTFERAIYFLLNQEFLLGTSPSTQIISFNTYLLQLLKHPFIIFYPSVFAFIFNLLALQLLRAVSSNPFLLFMRFFEKAFPFERRIDSPFIFIPLQFEFILHFQHFLAHQDLVQVKLVLDLFFGQFQV